MSITHNGFTFRCDNYVSEPYSHCAAVYLAVTAQTLRTATDHAREARWLIGRVRITIGGEGGRRVVLCPSCRQVIA